MTWKMLNPRATPDHLGLVPWIINASDGRPVAEQVADKYAHGGGWNPYGEGQWRLDDDGTLHYPGDPAFKPMAMTRVGDETVWFYDHALVCVRQPDASFAVVRLD